MKLVLIIVSLSIHLDQISKAAWLSRAIMQLAHVVQRSLVMQGSFKYCTGLGG